MSLVCFLLGVYLGGAALVLDVFVEVLRKHAKSVSRLSAQARVEEALLMAFAVICWPAFMLAISLGSDEGK